MANRALLVGINDYQSVRDLRGCLNDVTNMRNILKTYYNFTNNDIRVLTDSRATKQNILERLTWLVGKCSPDDRLVFHFSGHGSQIRDRDKDEELLDGTDELICPYDMDWNGTFITDDNLYDVFKELPDGTLLEVILDCCHSGDGIREVGLTPPPELAPPTQIMKRFLQPPLDIECRYEGLANEMGKRSTFRAMRGPKNSVLWAACKDYQTSADAPIKGSYNGAFTYFFCHHVREANGTIDRSSLLKRIQNSLSFYRFNQIPELVCDTNWNSNNILTR